MNEKVFSYDDMPEGETDLKLEKFNLGPDLEDVIPVLKEVLANKSQRFINFCIDFIVIRLHNRVEIGLLKKLVIIFVGLRG